MTSDRSPTSRRLLTGALGGLVGTAAMTAAMRRLRGRLHEAERYPLPPREIIQSVAGRTGMERRAGESDLQDLTLDAHFAYGAAAGALYAVARPSDGILAGAGYGLLVWAASYLGWIPALAILEPATRHARRRNGLMLAAHVVWGATTALTIRELERAEAEGVRRPGRPRRALAGTGREIRRQHRARPAARHGGLVIGRTASYHSRLWLSFQERIGHRMT